MSGSYDRTIKLWELAEEECRGVGSLGTRGSVWTMAAPPAVDSRRMSRPFSNFSATTHCPGRLEGEAWDQGSSARGRIAPLPRSRRHSGSM